MIHRAIEPDFRRKGWEAANPISPKVLVFRSYHFARAAKDGGPPKNNYRGLIAPRCSYPYGLFNFADSILNGLSSFL
jgi:hypothetical protein